MKRRAFTQFGALIAAQPVAASLASPIAAAPAPHSPGTRQSWIAGGDMSTLVSALVDQGTPADMVQVGNETNAGMLWPDGPTDDWPQLTELLNAGARAVRDTSDAEVMLHLAEGGDNAEFRWWFDEAVEHGVDFDVIGASTSGASPLGPPWGPWA